MRGMLVVLLLFLTVNFRRSCTTCCSLNTNTSFVSTSNGGSFDGVYNFAEEPFISCSTVNFIYLLQCSTCSSQYVGETARELSTRMGEHRSTANPDTKTKGNFRLSQHYVAQMGIVLDSESLLSKNFRAQAV